MLFNKGVAVADNLGDGNAFFVWNIRKRSGNDMVAQKIGILFVIGFIFFAPCPALQADAVYLKTGQKITGRIVGKSEGIVVLRTEAGAENVYLLRDVQKVEDLPEAGTLPNVKNAVESRGALAGPIAIPIHSMIELDFKTRGEVYAIRKEAVAENSELWQALQVGGLPELLRGAAVRFLKPYEPRNDIFGQIIDNKPWWGIAGLVYYGPGPNSIEGASEESRFISNPYLLVGLDYPNAFIVPTGRTYKEVYPVPYGLFWSPDLKSAKVRYDISAFWREELGYHYESEAGFKRTLDLRAYNAHDLGFNYLYLIPEQSRNVTSGNPGDKAIYLRQFIHCGGSCGYSGGCNNMSPTMPEVNITPVALPATAVIALWRKEPGSTHQTPDMTFTIEMV